MDLPISKPSLAESLAHVNDLIAYLRGKIATEERKTYERMEWAKDYPHCSAEIWREFQDSTRDMRKMLEYTIQQMALMNVDIPSLDLATLDLYRLNQS